MDIGQSGCRTDFLIVGAARMCRSPCLDLAVSLGAFVTLLKVWKCDSGVIYRKAERGGTGKEVEQVCT